MPRKLRVGMVLPAAALLLVAMLWAAPSAFADPFSMTVSASATTSTMSLENGVYTPTADGANLNVTDLVNELRLGSVTVGDGGPITIASTVINSSSTTSLTFAGAVAISSSLTLKVGNTVTFTGKVTGAQLTIARGTIGRAGGCDREHAGADRFGQQAELQQRHAQRARDQRRWHRDRCSGSTHERDRINLLQSREHQLFSRGPQLLSGQVQRDVRLTQIRSDGRHADHGKGARGWAALCVHRDCDQPDRHQLHDLAVCRTCAVSADGHDLIAGQETAPT